MELCQFDYDDFFSVVGTTSNNIWLWCSWIWVGDLHFPKWCLQFWRGDAWTNNRQNVIRPVKSLLHPFELMLLCHFSQLTHLHIIFRTRSRGEQFLVRWAIPQLHDIDLLTRMVDPALGGKYPIKSLSHFADIISRCVQVSYSVMPLCEHKCLLMWTE